MQQTQHRNSIIKKARPGAETYEIMNETKKGLTLLIMVLYL